jgi:hypothetical protein
MKRRGRLRIDKCNKGIVIKEKGINARRVLLLKKDLE